MITEGAVVIVAVIVVMISISKCFDVDADQGESPRAKCLVVRPSPGLRRSECISPFAGERAELERSERAERLARDSKRIRMYEYHRTVICGR